MRFRRIVIKASIVLGVLGVLSIASVRWHGSSPDGKNSSGTGLFLARPAFAQENGVSFLEQEAGISAYMKAVQTIDLTKAKSAFRTVERETGEYVVGSIPLSGYAETEDVHAYVHKDGWIVTYYIKDEPPSKILDWNDYGEDEKINGTKLEIGIVAICTAVSVATKDVKYYDFRYPDANRMMIVAEAVWSGNEETFRMKLPGDFVFYDRAYSLYRSNSSYYTSMYLDGAETATARDLYTSKYGSLSATQLSLDVFHTVNIRHPGFCAIVLIYREA